MIGLEAGAFLLTAAQRVADRGRPHASYLAALIRQGWESGLGADEALLAAGLEGEPHPDHDEILGLVITAAISLGTEISAKAETLAELRAFSEQVQQ